MANYNRGYIGVTSGSVDDRIKQHRSDANGNSTSLLSDFMRKGAVNYYTVKSELTRKEAYDLEKKLRPQAMHLNEKAGGSGGTPFSGRSLIGDIADTRRIYSVYHIHKLK